MSAAVGSALEPSPVAPSGLPRLLAGLRTEGAVPLDRHLAELGAIPRGDLIAAVEASGLRGRGGASFPTGTKLRAVAAQRRRPVVVVNAAEAEPVSGKDRVLLGYVPHLVLDGAAAAAAAIGARDAIVAVNERATSELDAVARAIEERAARRLDGRVSFRVATVPARFVVVEETALVSAVDGGRGNPTLKPPLPFERGVRGAPTLVQNAETLAHLALIARFGPEWFRAVGTLAEPGSCLVTVSGAIQRPGVYEVALGTPLTTLVANAGGLTEAPQAFLVGGYFGTWVTAAAARSLALSAEGLRPAGASLGAGAIVVLPESACGVAETARVARYLAGESAGQCGPCVFGLDAIAGALEQLARGERIDVRPRLARWLEQVKGRGACRHPDGAARLVGSALAVFAPEIARHAGSGGCARTGRRVLPVPDIA
jgi:NADH:ubiquinone oxidoreductase subunit F (NADH-binding)